MIKHMKNVDFKYEDLSNNIRGYYIYISQKRQIIRVNKSLSENARKYVLFHEIGHCILNHRGKVLLYTTNSINKIKEEHYADLFAAYCFKLYRNITNNNIDEILLPKKVKELIQIFL